MAASTWPAKNSLTGCCPCIAAACVGCSTHPALTLIVLFITIALNVVLIIKIPKGFFPVEDTGAISGSVRGPQDSSFPAMDNSIRQIGEVIKKDPAVANVIAFTGGNGATNTGSLYVALKPLNERNVSAAQIINRLRPQLNRLPVASAFLQAVQDLRIGGRSSNAHVSVHAPIRHRAGSFQVGADHPG